jgi:HD-like signal output (HDOD) protein
MNNLLSTSILIANQAQPSVLVENILKSIKIPPCPEVLIGLMEEMQKPEVDFGRLTSHISKDVGLAAAVLKTANSPFFATHTHVGSIQHAVSVLGMKNLIQVVRSSVLQKTLAGNKMAMSQFWERSNLTAVVASNMAKKLYDSPEDAYTIGLFHDCGIPVLMQKFPDYKIKLAASTHSAEQIVPLEDKYYNTNHAVVGNLLARNWYLPDHVSQAILVHHDYTIYTQPDDRCTPKVCALAAITQLAEHIAAALLGRPEDSEWQVNGTLALNHLGLSAEDMDTISEAAVTELEGIRASL